MSANVATLLLGSNLGKPEENIVTALSMLEQGLKIKTKGDFHLSEAEGFSSSNTFCNIAIYVETDLSPVQLLTFIKKIERTLGRKEDSGAEKNYKDRIIDIDIVTFNDLTFTTENLVIPHKLHLYEREFSKPVLESLKKNLTKTEI